VVSIITVENQLSGTYSELVFVALGTQHETHMHLIFICSLYQQHFSILFHKSYDFRRKFLIIECEFQFPPQISPETFFIVQRIKWDMIKMCICLHVKCPLLLSDINETWIFSKDFRKVLEYKIL
jgi:hypothetical protein